MFHYVKEFPVLEGTIQNYIFDFVNANKGDLQMSELYSSLEDKKFINTDERSSKFKTFTDKKLFEYSNKLIDVLNSKDEYYAYILVENDVTYIEYSEGDFFKLHEDYLSITSNIIEEFTLLICMDANCEGGETIFYLNKYFTHVSKASTTKNSCVLFRKDIKHEGSKLRSGYKKIITLNLWGIPKQSDNLLVISLKDSKKYIISFEKIYSTGDNILKGYIEFCRNQGNNNSILIYEDHQIDSDGFKIIYDIMNKSYVKLEDVHEHANIIDYYCIDTKYIMIDQINNKSINKSFPQSLDDDIILCENEDNLRYLCEFVKEQQLPLIPFKILLCEGVITYGGGLSGTEPLILKLAPVFMSMSEFDNILFVTKIITKDDIPYSFNSILEYNIDKDLCHVSKDKIFVFDDIDYTDYDEDLYVVLPQCQPYSTIIPRLGFYLQDFKIANIIKNLMTPNENLEMYSIENSKVKIKSNGEFYDIDENDKMLISVNKIDTVLNKLKSMNFIENVIDKMKKTKFNFPQSKEFNEHFFCNENVYGHFNLFYITGFLKID